MGRSDGVIAVEMTADEQQMFRALQRSEAQTRALVGRVKELEKAQNSAGDAAEKAGSRDAKATEEAARRKKDYKDSVANLKKIDEELWQQKAKAFRDEESQHQRMLSNVAAAVTGYFSLQTAMRLVNDEIRTKIELQKRAEDAQLTEESAENTLFRNMPNASRVARAQATAQSEKIADETGVQSKYIKRALASALSASGGELTPSIAAVKAGAQLLYDEPTSIPMYAGAMLDLAKISGTTDAAVNRGLLQFVAGVSRVVDPRMAAEHIPKAMIGVQNYGATAAESTALYSALSVAGADVEGRQSGQGAIALAAQLRSFLPETGVPETVKKEGLSEEDTLARAKLLKSTVYKTALHRKEAKLDLSDEQLRALKKEETYAKRERGEVIEGARPALHSFGERLAYLQSHPELAKRFMDEASFELKVQGPIEQLLSDPNSVAATKYREFTGMMPGIGGRPDVFGRTDQTFAQIIRAGLPGPLADVGKAAWDTQRRNDSLAAMGDEMVEAMRSGQLAQVGSASRAYARASEKMLISNLKGGMGSVNREGLKRMLLDSGETSLATKIENIKWEVGSGLGTSGGTQEAIQALQQRREELAHPKELQYIGPGSRVPEGAQIHFGSTSGPSWQTAYDVPRAQTDTERHQTEAFDRMIVVLNSILEETKANKGSTLAKPDSDR